MTSYQLTFILLLVSGITISGYHRRRAGYARDKDVTPKDEGTLILGARIVGGGALLLGMVGYAITPGWFSWATIELPSWIRWTGAGLAGVSLPLFWWVFTNLGANITDTVVTRSNHTLVQSGPYRFVHHPRYTVGVLFFAGLSLLTGSWSSRPYA